MTTAKRLGWMVPVIMACLILMAGCGGGGQQTAPREDGANNAQRDQAQDEGRIINIGSGDFYFEPADITVQRGERVTLVVSNDGAVAHNISIDEFNIDETYNVGQTARVTFTPNQTGTFQIYCDEPGHTSAGMVGTLTVR